MSARVEPYDDLSPAVTALREGRVVAVPTDTVFGLAVDPENGEAVELLRHMKASEAQRPIAVLLSSLSQAVAVAGQWPWHVQSLTESYWPGPLTAVVPVAARRTLQHVQSERRTVGLRIPDSPMVCELIRLFGRPIAATSANTAGAAPLRTSQEIASAFGAWSARLFVVPQEMEHEGIASTVVDLSGDWDITAEAFLQCDTSGGAGAWPAVLREGTIRKAMIVRTLTDAARRIANSSH